MLRRQRPDIGGDNLFPGAAVISQRLRRGISLLETMLVLVIAAFATIEIIQTVGSMSARSAERAAARTLSDIADRVTELIRADYGAYVTSTNLTAHDAQQVTWSSLQARGLEGTGTPFTQGLRQDLEAWLIYDSIGKQLDLVILTDRPEIDVGQTPIPDGFIHGVGRVTDAHPHILVGRGFERNLRPIVLAAAMPGTNPLSGELAALRRVTLAPLSPVLHAAAVPGDADNVLTTMETPLHMSGYSIGNAGVIETDELTTAEHVGAEVVWEVSQDLTVRGDIVQNTHASAPPGTWLQVREWIEPHSSVPADTVELLQSTVGSREIQAGRLGSTTEDLDARDVEVSTLVIEGDLDASTGASVEFDGITTVQSLIVGDDLDLDWLSLEVGALHAGAYRGDSIQVDDRIELGNATVNGTVAINNCQGSGCP